LVVVIFGNCLAHVDLVPVGTVGRTYRAESMKLAGGLLVLLALAVPVTGSARDAATCATGHLHGAVFATSGAAGTIAVGVSLKNTGTTACTLRGYASLRLANARGQLPTTVTHGGLQPFKTTPKTVLVQPGRKATVLLAYNEVPSGPLPCPKTSTLLLRPPGASGWLTIGLTAYACRHRLYESPVLAGIHNP
jgi:hypothetical protein